MNIIINRCKDNKPQKPQSLLELRKILIVWNQDIEYLYNQKTQNIYGK